MVSTLGQAESKQVAGTATRLKRLMATCRPPQNARLVSALTRRLKLAQKESEESLLARLEEIRGALVGEGRAPSPEMREVTRRLESEIEALTRQSSVTASRAEAAWKESAEARLRDQRTEADLLAKMKEDYERQVADMEERARLTEAKHNAQIERLGQMLTDMQQRAAAQNSSPVMHQMTEAFLSLRDELAEHKAEMRVAPKDQQQGCGYPDNGAHVNNVDEDDDETAQQGCAALGSQIGDEEIMLEVAGSAVGGLPLTSDDDEPDNEPKGGASAVETLAEIMLRKNAAEANKARNEEKRRDHPEQPVKNFLRYGDDTLPPLATLISAAMQVADFRRGCNSTEKELKKAQIMLKQIPESKPKVIREQEAIVREVDARLKAMQRCESSRQKELLREVIEAIRAPGKIVGSDLAARDAFITKFENSFRALVTEIAASPAHQRRVNGAEERELATCYAEVGAWRCAMASNKNAKQAAEVTRKVWSAAVQRKRDPPRAASAFEAFLQEQKVPDWKDRPNGRGAGTDRTAPRKQE